LEIAPLTTEEVEALDTLYRSTKDVRVRTRTQIVLLAGEQRMTAPIIAKIVRTDDQTVRNWFKRWTAEGIQGLKDRPMPERPAKVTQAYKEQVLMAVRRRPRALGQPYSMWTYQRLADYMAEQTGLRVSYETVRRVLAAGGIVLSRPQHKVSSPDPEYLVKKRRLKKGDVFYYADEFNLSWLPTLRAMYSPVGQQVMIPTPRQPDKYYGIGAVNYHTGETVVLFRRRKRRVEIAELLQALLDKHPTGTIYVAWDNVDTHEDDEVEEVVRAAAGRLILLYLPTYSPWLNPIEMLWRHFRREVTHCELFETKQALLAAAQQFFDRYNQCPERILSVIGSKTKKVS
jgi:putative transposase